GVGKPSANSVAVKPGGRSGAAGSGCDVCAARFPAKSSSKAALARRMALSIRFAFILARPSSLVDTALRRDTHYRSASRDAPRRLLALCDWRNSPPRLDIDQTLCASE